MTFAGLKRKLVATLIGVTGLVVGTSASAIVVGGVDFGAQGNIDHIETTTLAETLINDNGQNLMGYGQVNTVNGNVFYAGTDRLYFTFTGYTSANFSATAVDFTGGVISVYLGPTFNLLNQDSPTNMATIQSYTPWATLTGHADQTGFTLRATGTLTGTALAFNGAGLLDVTGGLADVVAYLNNNLIGDGAGGFADIALATSGDNVVLNSNDNITGCRDGTAQVGQWCIAGSADLRGPTVVPEPASMALVGLALLGMGASLRKRKA